MSPNIKRFLQTWAINTLAVLVAVSILPGIRYERIVDLFVASLLLGVLNAFVRPILLLMALPLLIFSLGLFIFVINALLLYFIGSILTGFHVDSFWWAFGGALVISTVSFFLNLLTGNKRGRIETQRPPNPPDPGPPGKGPIIDV
ncbi:MAG TPA: phage holin family protein [Verrucomicrobiae bacterium]|nr:phage holin family protein [Verrucomicrobiae bacterium]